MRVSPRSGRCGQARVAGGIVGYAQQEAGPHVLRVFVKQQKRLVSAVADRVVAGAIHQRPWRVQQLQDLDDDMLALRAAQKKLYAGQRGEATNSRSPTPRPRR